jgi:hypothetical protein
MHREATWWCAYDILQQFALLLAFKSWLLLLASKAHVFCAGKAIVQFAQGLQDNRAYAIKFLLDENIFYTEAALYVAVFPHLKQWLSERAADALARITALSGDDGGRMSDDSPTMQAAVARFLPQVALSCTLFRTLLSFAMLPSSCL